MIVKIICFFYYSNIIVQLVKFYCHVKPHIILQEKGQVVKEMDKTYMAERFDNASLGVCTRLRKILSLLPQDVKSNSSEIRLRANAPLCLSSKSGQLFISNNSTVNYIYKSGLTLVTTQDIEECYNLLCGFSIYTHENEIRQGFVTLCGGHRAGICGTAVVKDERTVFFRDISSINIRIAREIKGASNGLFDVKNGLLIAGPPLSGKTTVLRDLIRSLSVGLLSEPCRVALVDCRGEIAACVGGVPQNDVGPCTDVITGCGKAEGLEMAIRTLAPQYIAFDEIATLEEAQSVAYGMHSGVSVITTVHVGSVEELKKRAAVKAILASGAIKKVAFLPSIGHPFSMCDVENFEDGSFLIKAEKEVCSGA